VRPVSDAGLRPGNNANTLGWFNDVRGCDKIPMRKPSSKHLVLIVAGCAIAAVVVERSLVLYDPNSRSSAGAETEALRCAAPQAAMPPPFEDDAMPSVTQPGGIDPLGLSGAIRRALDDCP
jgi:hypothetical protein